jgi:hypothetical protein
MVRERADYPVIEWRDFKWKKKLIVVRDEVAKQTRARDKLRYVPLEGASVTRLEKSPTKCGKCFLAFDRRSRTLEVPRSMPNGEISRKQTNSRFLASQ